VAKWDDGLRTYISTKFLLRDSQGNIFAVCGISTDITKRKKTESLIVGQSMSLCPWCKRILNGETNQWETDESYMKDHDGDVEFSHCMCQFCAKRLGLFDPEKISENDDMLI